MEVTIDRASYRRSNRVNIEEPNLPKSNKSLKSIFFNEIIISMSILIGVLSVKLLDLSYAMDWLSNKLSVGVPFETIATKTSFMYDEILKSIHTFVNSEKIKSEEENSQINIDDSSVTGDNVEKSESMQSPNKDKEDNQNIESAEETTQSITYESAVEGVNQLSEDAIAVKEKFNIIRPVNGIVTSVFGARNDSNPIVSSYHTGLDLAANTGTIIVASHDGEVTYAGVLGGYGKCIKITNEELTTLYGHCSKINVKNGEKVKQGDKIGEVGMTGNATGPHVHFEIIYEGRYLNPEDVV